MTKSILLKAVVCVIIFSSCTSHKSFLRQRYTHYGHSKSHSVAQQSKERVAGKKETGTVSVAAVVTQNQARADEQKVNDQTLFASHAIRSNKTGSIKKGFHSGFMPLVVKPVKDLSSRLPSTSYSKAKQISKDNAVEKRGLLFGVIDAILAIILAALFVALIVLLVLILL
jgi:hypothetical protein